MGKLSTHEKGRKGEAQAEAYLRFKGYQVLERNYRTPQGEIDLIVRKGGTLAFVEVKSRKSASQGGPLEAVSLNKARRISAAAAVYLARHPQVPRDCRFDVVSIGPDRNWMGLPKVRHLKNAFTPEETFNV